MPLGERTTPRTPPTSLDALRWATLPDLERIYARRDESARSAPLRLPTGRFRGHYLRLVESHGARRWDNRLMVWLGFALPRFGVDFTSCAWWFHHPSLQVGAFEPRRGPSRWRSTDTLQLRYHPSRLPWPVKPLLYDEVLPLSDDLCLGLGGINRERGEGDLFYFALAR